MIFDEGWGALLMIRTLFCIAVTQEFFNAGDEERTEAMEAIPGAFADLAGRFGATVLGTFDDDRVMAGASTGWPWTSYILADVPDLAAVEGICGIVRETRLGDRRLWKYLRIEARVGRQLFFGNA
ncbi:hypothetical protein I5Q34_33070 [Streptomyces sp. AV19]|uniref:hypothetical protein n=1 Tax=Streptomyces sp. AV19 TaxID=2793068 RepID=UPI0018FE2778|nr:hypothetical protein [Streptomyces sp. AV19]MBH1939035.1 hypothetical protein [Streptomyces sp. AV19]MDG4533945.1 hypothetical protein [Streptomyces sp. AV19]